MPFIMATPDQLPDAPDAVRSTPNSSKRKRSDASVEIATKSEDPSGPTRDNAHDAPSNLHAFLKDVYELLKRYVTHNCPICHLITSKSTIASTLEPDC